MDQFVVVRILQRTGHLIDIRYDCVQRHASSRRMDSTDTPMRSIAHNEKWNSSLNTIILHLNNMRMIQGSNDACLRKKLLPIRLCQRHSQDFQGSPCIEMDMFS